MTDLRDEKVIAGLSCSGVLALLSDYLDGDLEPSAREQVEAHLRGCDGCARFGGQFRATVSALRVRLGAPAVLPEVVLERLRQAIDQDR